MAKKVTVEMACQTLESFLDYPVPKQPVHRRQLTNTEKKFLPHAVTKTHVIDEEEVFPKTPAGELETSNDISCSPVNLMTRFGMTNTVASKQPVVYQPVVEESMFTDASPIVTAKMF